MTFDYDKSNLDADSDAQTEVLSDKQTPSLSLFGRLIDCIKTTFMPSKETKLSSLQGRIHENETNILSKKKLADTVLDNFLSLAQKMEAKLDSELVVHVQAAMELITRDFRRIQKKVVNTSGEESEKVYHNWMTKAKRWIELDTKLHDRVAIIDTVIKQFFLDLDDLIDQDLQVIFDYEAHILADLSVSADEKAKLEQIILAKLAPHTQALIQLKEHPYDLELYKVAEWKEKVDARRQKHFDKALHAIDAIIANFSPESIDFDEELPSEEVNEITSELEILHQACNGLLSSIQKLTLSDPANEIEIKNLKSSLCLLQEKAHHLHGNLHLTHEHFDYLQGIQEDLNKIQLQIES